MAPARQGLSEEENTIYNMLLQMGTAAGRAIEDAMTSLQTHDLALAQEIISHDSKINALQHQVEDLCLVTIARQQPVAHDLRDLVANTYIASDLERIGDNAADIASIVLQMPAAPEGECAKALIELGHKCRDMLQGVMEAYKERNEELARQIAAQDDEVDAGEQKIIAGVFEKMNTASDYLLPTQILWTVHNVERIGDHITNIAERVVFMETGINVDLNRS